LKGPRLLEISHRISVINQQFDQSNVAEHNGQVVLRQHFQDRGVPKLSVRLDRQGIRLPLCTIHRILLRRGLVREPDRHRPSL
jgi:hypothetical protein